MNWFKLDKLYADLVTLDGEVVVVYLGWLRVAGFRTSYAAVERYTADGGRRIIHGRPLHADGPRVTGGSVEYAVVTPFGSVFRLTHHAPVPAWHPGDPPISPHVRWHIGVPHAKASAGWDDGRSATLVGDGYSDWVTLLRPPRWLGLRRLQWGRVHLPDRTVVFNTVDHASAAPWTRLIEWRADGHPVAVTVDGAPRSPDWTVDAPGGKITLHPTRTLHAGDPLDSERFPGAAERWATHVANGPADETRLFSRAATPEGASGLALHESVTFGRSIGHHRPD